MRLFIAIDLDELIRQRIARYLDGVRGFAPDVPWVSPQSLHVTLKFIGESNLLDSIKEALSKVQATGAHIAFRGTGFFPSVKSARVFWVGIEADEHLAKLARSIDVALLALGIPKEERAFAPHLTLARSGYGTPRRQGSDSPNKRFQHLQEQLARMPAPEFGTMTAHEFFLYQSKTAPGGAVYTKLASFALR